MPAKQPHSKLAEPDIRALELVNTFMHGSSKTFMDQVREAPIQVVASLIRIAQPSYATQYRETAIAAVAAGVVTSWISWTMAAEPKNRPERRARLWKTIRNAALGVGVTLLMARLRNLRSPERDALQAIRRSFPQKVYAAEQLVHGGYHTSFLPALSA